MSNVVHASPTKDFFITMLTKDIKLERAIIDLIDNSIDGAKRTRGNGDFSGLTVGITINKDEFIIRDNCGGFSLDVATNFAFMFGRPPESGHNVKHSVGRFGVGMKRALFKIGKFFEVETKHEDDHFQVSVDVNSWNSRPNEWFFEYTIITPETNNILGEDGTFIKVTKLNKDVIYEFFSDIFLTNLKAEIERTLSFSLDKNLSIMLNHIPLKKSGLSMLEGDKLRPYYKAFKVDDVDIKIYAGVGKPSPDLAGWYVYCNDRLVLEKDKTNLTGWEGRRIGESGVQKFHYIFSMFRGMVFFSSDDAKRLPMTTTKTGIDSNSPVFKAARHEMINAMTQVISFLKSFESDDQRNSLIAASDEVDVAQLESKNYIAKFVAPQIRKVEEVSDQYSSVCFKADKQLIKKVQSFFGVLTNKEVGEKLFEYFTKREQENL